MATELRYGIGCEKGIREDGAAKGSSKKWRWLKDDRSDRKEMRVGAKGKRNGAKLWGEGEPSDSTMGQEDVTAGASSRRWFDAGIVRRETTKRTKSKRKVGDGGLQRKGVGDRFGRRGR